MALSRNDIRFVTIAAVLLLPLAGFGQTASPDKEWGADLSIYMLAPGMSGNTTVRGTTATVDTPFSKIWENLQFGGMARPTLRYQRWSVSTDVIYMGLGVAKSGLDVGYDQWLVEPVIQYRVTPWLSPYAGARYLSVKGDIRGPRGRTGTGKQEWWDPVVGADVRVPLKPKLAIRVHGDVGGFGAGSSFSGQIEPMLDWSLGRMVSLQFGYRWLYADYRTGEGNSLFRYDLQTRGPQFGATFHF